MVQCCKGKYSIAYRLGASSLALVLYYSKFKLLFSIWLGLLFYHKSAAAKSLQSCPTLCNPIDGSQPGSSIPGILQARILEWIAISFSNACLHAKSLQSCSTLCDSTDGSPPGSSVHRTLQARHRSGLPFPALANPIASTKTIKQKGK